MTSAARQLRASHYLAGADSSGLGRSVFRVVVRKWLNHAALRSLPKLRVASSSLVARLEESPGNGAFVLDSTPKLRCTRALSGASRAVLNHA
jgi:hypothetical protein